MKIPFIYRNKLRINPDKFVATNPEFHKQLKEIARDEKLVELYGTAEKAYEALTKDNVPSFSGATFKLPTGETVTIGQSESLKLAANRVTLESMKKVENGATGLGDIEVGMLYNFLKADNYLVSCGAGPYAFLLVNMKSQKC